MSANVGAFTCNAYIHSYVYFVFIFHYYMGRVNALVVDRALVMDQIICSLSF